MKMYNAAFEKQRVETIVIRDGESRAINTGCMANKDKKVKLHTLVTQCELSHHLCEEQHV